MEKQLFDWIDWDQVDTLVFMFYNVTLKVAVGDIPTGTHFDSAFVNYEKGELAFYDKDGDNNPAHEFELQLAVLTK